MTCNTVSLRYTACYFDTFIYCNNCELDIPLFYEATEGELYCQLKLCHTTTYKSYPNFRQNMTLEKKKCILKITKWGILEFYNFYFNFVDFKDERFVLFIITAFWKMMIKALVLGRFIYYDTFPTDGSAVTGKEVLHSNSPKMLWAHTLCSGQLPAASASQRLHAAPRLPGSSGPPLEDRHLDLILRVMDHQSVG